MKERGRERERKEERWKGERKRGEEGGRTEGSFSYRLHLPTYSPAIPRFQTGVIKCSQESVWHRSARPCYIAHSMIVQNNLENPDWATNLQCCLNTFLHACIHSKPELKR